MVPKLVRKFLHRFVGNSTNAEEIIHNPIESLLPPEQLRYDYYRTLDPQTFESICQGAKLELTTRGLRPEHRVLDIGCGIGNLALALRDTLHGGYDGVEIHRAAVEWCQRAITPSYPNFRFHHADLVSKVYNPNGHQSASTYRFPFPDRSFDFIFLGSVFTHMLPDGVANYLREISRLLKPTGIYAAGYFLLNDESIKGILAGKSFLSFRVEHASDLCLLHDRDSPEAAVALKEEFIERCHREAGLRIKDIRRGGWWSGERNDQDVVASVLSE